MTPAEQAQAFAGALLGDHGEVLNGLQLTLSAFTSSEPGPRTHWLPATEQALASAVLAAAAGGDTTGVYVGVGLTRGLRAIDPATGKKYKRLAKSDVDGLAWLWIDIDVAGPAHGYKMPLFPDKATAIKFVMNLGLPPTVLVDTGHGIQAHWRLREPFIYGAVDSDDDGVPVIDEARVAADRKAGEELAWAWVKSFQIRAKLAGEVHIPGGWHVDPTTDPSRLVRCPGSYNRKIEGDHRLVTVLESDPARRYDLDDFQAVLMPDEFLAPYRYDHDTLTGVLAGVDLVALWGAAKGFPDHTPPWLSMLFEVNAAPELEALWVGDRDADYKHDDSSIDMALVRTLFRLRVGADKVAQAVMCRRLRRCEPGKKVDKVDPTQRSTYLKMTLGKVVSTIKEEESKEVKRADTTAEMRAAEASATPRHLQAVPDLAVDDPGPGAPSEGEPPSDDAERASDDGRVAGQVPTEVAADGPTPNETAFSLGVESEECKEAAVSLHSDPPNAGKPEIPLASLRALPTPEREDYDPYPDAVRVPRLGIDNPVPAMPKKSEEADHSLLAGQLGLPGEVVIRAIGERRLAGEDEFRVWFYRRETDAVQGGRWRPYSVDATRWRPKADWDQPSRITALLLHDLHLTAKVTDRWARADNPNGRRMLYKLARWMPAGTPEEVVRLAVVGLLRKSTGTRLFSTARTTRDPWVEDAEGVWVAWVNIQDAIRQLGHPPMKPMTLDDTLTELRCKVQAEMAITEGHSVVHDTEKWVRVPVELPPPDLWETIGMQATDRDAQDKRNDVRSIQP